MGQPDGVNPNQSNPNPDPFTDMHKRVRLTSLAHPHPDYPLKFTDEEGDKFNVYVDKLQPDETLDPGDIVRLDGTMVKVIEIINLDEEPGLRLTVLKIP